MSKYEGPTLPTWRQRQLASQAAEPDVKAASQRCDHCGHEHREHGLDNDWRTPCLVDDCSCMVFTWPTQETYEEWVENQAASLTVNGARSAVVKCGV